MARKNNTDEELKAFFAEAAELLGVENEQTNATVPASPSSQPMEVDATSRSDAKRSNPPQNRSRNLGELTPEDLVSLKLSETTTDTDLAALAAKSNVTRMLRGLNLQSSKITDAGVVQLKKLRALEGLSITNCTAVSDVSLGHIASLEHLKRLGLGGTQVTNDGLALLKPLVHLELLNLGHTQVDDDAATHLNAFPLLHTLRLENTGFGDRGMAILSEQLPLKELSLAGTMVGDASVQKLAKFPSLRVLIVGRSQLSEAGFKTLENLLPNVRIVR